MEFTDVIRSVHVDEAFFHCSKCMIRSHLWQHEQWPPARTAAQPQNGADAPLTANGALLAPVALRHLTHFVTQTRPSWSMWTTAPPKPVAVIS